MQLLALCTLLAVAVSATTAFQWQDTFESVLSTSRKLKEFVLTIQMPVPEDPIKHLVGTAESVLVDGQITPLKCAHSFFCNTVQLRSSADAPTALSYLYSSTKQSLLNFRVFVVVQNL